MLCKNALHFWNQHEKYFQKNIYLYDHQNACWSVLFFNLYNYYQKMWKRWLNYVNHHEKMSSDRSEIDQLVDHSSRNRKVTGWILGWNNIFSSWFMYFNWFQIETTVVSFVLLKFLLFIIIKIINLRTLYCIMIFRTKRDKLTLYFT